MLDGKKAKNGLQGRAWHADMSNILLDTAKDWLKKGLATACPLATLSIVIHGHENFRRGQYAFSLQHPTSTDLYVLSPN